MSEKAKFEDQKKKLQGLCDEHDFVFRFRNDCYPISLTIMPTGGVGAQMSLLENAEEKGYMSPDAEIVFAYKDGELDIKTSETFTIRESLFTNLKNIYKKMHFYWLQFFNREIIEKGILQELPEIEQEEPEDDGAEDTDTATITTTVDGSGLVTHVEFSGSEGDDNGPPEDDAPGDGDLPGGDDPEADAEDYDYDDPEDETGDDSED